MTKETDELKTTVQLALDAIDKKNWGVVGQRLDEAQSQVRVITSRLPVRAGINVGPS